MSLPTTTRAWVLESQTGVEGLKLVNDFPVPLVKDDEVLVKIHAVSLNYRELVVVKARFIQPHSEKGEIDH